MSRTYTVSGSNLTVIANATLVFINPSSTVGFVVLRAWCGQRGTLTSQNLGVQLSTQVTAFPTLVSATPVSHHWNISSPVASGIVGGTAGAAGTSGVNASAEGAGAKTIIIADSFNNQNGWLYVPTPPDEQIRIDAGISSGFGLVLQGTPTTLTGWSFGVTFSEGG